MNKFLFAASTALTAMVMAPAAHATSDLSIVLPAMNASDAYSIDAAGVTDIFSIVLGTSGYFTASFSGVPSSTFTGISGGLYSGSTLLTSFNFFTVDGVTFGSLGSTLVTAPGAYTLRFTGMTLGSSYAGSGTLSAVPETSTWAMMVAGIAALGMTMRRRTTMARVSFS